MVDKIKAEMESYSRALAIMRAGDVDNDLRIEEDVEAEKFTYTVFSKFDMDMNGEITLAELTDRFTPIDIETILTKISLLKCAKQLDRLRNGKPSKVKKLGKKALTGACLWYPLHVEETLASLRKLEDEEICKVVGETIRSPKLLTKVHHKISEEFDKRLEKSRLLLSMFYRDQCAASETFIHSLKEALKKIRTFDSSDLDLLLAARAESKTYRWAIDSSVMGETTPSPLSQIIGGLLTMFKLDAVREVWQTAAFIAHALDTVDQRETTWLGNDVVIQTYHVLGKRQSRKFHVAMFVSRKGDVGYDVGYTVILGDAQLKVKGKKETLGERTLSLASAKTRLTIDYPGLFKVNFIDMPDVLGDNVIPLEILRRNQQGEEPIAPELLRGISVVNFKRENPGKLADYKIRGRTASISTYVSNEKSSSKLAAFVHEIIHHWEMTLTRGRYGSVDPSQIFCRLSWRGKKRRLDQDVRDFFGGNARGDNKKHSMKDCSEDMARAGDAAFEDGAAARRYVRDQMSVGNFEPAIKQLFIKYYPFGGNEYGVSRKSSPLTYAEVRQATGSWLKKYPGTIRETTLQTLDEIGKYALHPLE